MSRSAGAPSADVHHVRGEIGHHQALGRVVDHDRDVEAALDRGGAAPSPRAPARSAPRAGNTGAGSGPMPGQPAEPNQARGEPPSAPWDAPPLRPGAARPARRRSRRSPRAPRSARARGVEAADHPPPSTTEMVAVSSRPITRASVSSDPDRRTVARPDALGWVGSQRGGRMQPACAMRRAMITAPSCSGNRKEERVSSSFDAARWGSRTDLIVEVGLALEHDQAARASARGRAARTTPPASATPGGPRRPGRSRGPRAPARRISCWKSTMMISTAEERKLSRIRRSVSS
jgi:hypothetical protein